MGEAVAARPIGALGTGLAVMIIHTFFMRTANDAVDHGHGADLMLTEKCLDFRSDCVVATDVALLGKPALKQIGLASFIGHNRDGDLGSQRRGGTVKRNARDGVALKAALGLVR